jgi:hypothetical protein
MRNAMSTDGFPSQKYVIDVQELQDRIRDVTLLDVRPAEHFAVGTIAGSRHLVTAVLGHPDARLLDGGSQAWRRAGGELHRLSGQTARKAAQVLSVRASIVQRTAAGD